MNILLLDRDENLIDHIDIFDPEDEESLNADSTLTFSTFYKNIEKGYRILYQDRLNEWHEYIIQLIKTKHNSSDDIFLEVYAENSFYETLGDYIEDKRPRNSTATNALSEALTTSRWEVGVVENLGLNTTSFYRCSVKDAVQNKIVKVWGGEFSTSIKVEGNKIVSRKVNIYKKRGDDHGKRFVYGKDIHEIEKVVNEEDIITALYGFGKGEEIEETGGHGRRIDFADINNGKKYVENNAARLKYGRNSDKGKVHVFGKIEFDDITDKRELLAKTKEELEKASTPKITYNAAVEDLVKHGFEYEGVRLGDTVTVIDEELGLRLKARVIKLVKNLDNSSADKITLGNFVETTNDLFIEAYKKINDFRNKEAIWDSASKKIQDGIDAEFLNNVIDKLNTEINNSGGYVYISKDGKGIITYDKPLDQNPTKAIQLMGGSIRIANKKKSDGTWDWRSFGTGDGFVADEIITGILKGGNVKWNLNDGTFLIGESEDNYLLKFDGSTLKFGSGSIGKSDLSEELKQELKGKDGESFKFNLISNGDFHNDFTKDEPSDSSSKLNEWQVATAEKMKLVYILPAGGKWVMAVKDPDNNGSVEVNQYLDLKDNTKYYVKFKATSNNMSLYYYGTNYVHLAKVTELDRNNPKVYSAEFTTHKVYPHKIQFDCKQFSEIHWIILSESPIPNDIDWYPSKQDLIGKPGKDGEPGPPGKDGSMADLPPALKAWNGNATEISGKYVFTPELFVGNGSYENKTGIYIGENIRAKYHGYWQKISGMVGMENGEVNWMFTHSGNLMIGRKFGETIQLGSDGRAIIPMIKTNMIEAGAITAEKIKSGEITTDFLYPGTSERIILERGYSPGSNDCKSIDANGSAIRLKVNAGTYIAMRSSGSVGMYSGGSLFFNFSPNENWIYDAPNKYATGSGVLNLFDAHVVMGWLEYYVYTVKSDKRVKDDIKYIGIEDNAVNRNNIFEFIKNVDLATYKYKKIGGNNLSMIAQDVLKFRYIKDYLIAKDSNGLLSINMGNYTSMLHVALQEEIKKRETLEDRVGKLEEELAEIKKLLKERGIG
ncbi:MAG: phage tail protein [Peptostreptococcus stomatis]|uniref:phage tail spike protein n=1 Tax=Peptostreptococcus stomatis TaxID=341694 RepID=UPI001A527374|nr:phage tail spike protein [Peptostreptococcus stomatis]MBL6465409.1 phage tail protein [Peptostreptococcus stomatis]